MLDKLAHLISILVADPTIHILAVGVIADLLAKLSPKFQSWGLTSHRVAWLRDFYRAVYPRLAVALPALWHFAMGTEHPEVEALLERVAKAGSK